MLEILNIKNVSVSKGDTTLLSAINLKILPGEQWMIYGASGSGKTSLAHVLTGHLFYSGEIHFNFSPTAKVNTILVEQQHHFKNRSHTTDFYYQQRFNSFDAEDSNTVKENLQHYPVTAKQLDLLKLYPLLQKPLIQLSNGENKRLQLAKALSLHPQLLLLDNPFIGLDADGRQTLHNILNELVKEQMHLILFSSTLEIPECITHILVLEKGTIKWAGKKADFPIPLKNYLSISTAAFDAIKQISPPAFNAFTYAVKMKEVSVTYGNKKILEKINWEVKRGECWNVSGSNGAGKSTLLSLITADNPQAYANEIYLFDKKRGSGESIWDIKQKIGFVSPELHLFFEQQHTCFEVVASGLFDTIGLFRQLTSHQKARVEAWINLLNLNQLQQRPMFQLSNSQQRMVLLARAFIKNPPLLILDEPCQGLDEEQTSFFSQLINDICTRLGTTLIYVSHYAKDIPACVTQFLPLKEGRIAL